MILNDCPTGVRTPPCVHGRQFCVQCHYEEPKARMEASQRQHPLPNWPAEYQALQRRVAELEALINTPHTDEWFEGVRLEAAHQIERWGSEHDAGKTPADWFWLLGYLGGKALAAALAGNQEKAKHHTISSGAALLNWYRAITGDNTAMRPGIAEEGKDP